MTGLEKKEKKKKNIYISNLLFVLDKIDASGLCGFGTN